MKHLKKFNEAEIINPHAWRNKPAVVDVLTDTTNIRIFF